MNKPSFKIYGMEFVAANKPSRGRPKTPKYKTYLVNQVLKSYQPKNGHYKAVTTRPLTDADKALIKERFLKLGGVIREDATKLIKRGIPDVTIFQIVGAVNNLHRQVQKGIIQVKNPARYYQKLDAKRQEWASWNSPKYQALRDKLNGLIQINPVIKISRPNTIGRPRYFAPSSIAFAYPSMV